MARAKLIYQEVRQRETVEIDMSAEANQDPSAVFKVVSERLKAGWHPVTMTVVFERLSGSGGPMLKNPTGKRRRTRISSI